MNLKNYKHLIQVFLLVKVTLTKDGAQLYLIFKPIYKTMTTFSGLPDTISKWESKRLSNETFPPLFKTSKSLCPKLVWYI